MPANVEPADNDTTMQETAAISGPGDETEEALYIAFGPEFDSIDEIISLASAVDWTMLSFGTSPDIRTDGDNFSYPAG